MIGVEITNMTLNEDIAVISTRGAKKELRNAIDHKLKDARSILDDSDGSKIMKNVGDVRAILNDVKEMFQQMNTLVIEPKPEEEP